MFSRLQRRSSLTPQALCRSHGGVQPSVEAIRGMFASGAGASGGGGGPNHLPELHDDEQDEYGPKQVDKKVQIALFALNHTVIENGRGWWVVLM